jgi:UDP-glucose:(glucosyl)LPS alpha-1,2-glucosyltransferase
MNIIGPQGGSEIVYNGIVGQIDNSYWDQINLILSNCDLKLINPNKKNILLQQLSYDQPLVQNIKDPEYLNQIDCIVFVSHWQYEKFNKILQVPAYKSIVIPNATARTTYVPRTNTRRKLVYTSTPWRGLSILLHALQLLTDVDVQVDIFSSTQIYGQQFYQDNDHLYQPLWQMCEADPRIILHGYQPNSIVREHLQSCDIFSYPNIWEETFCISALEALIAGCKVVTTNYGALPELCGRWADYVPYGSNHEILTARYAQCLLNVIQTPTYDGSSQANYYNQHYTWDQIIPQWIRLFDNVLQGQLPA